MIIVKIEKIKNKRLLKHRFNWEISSYYENGVCFQSGIATEIEIKDKTVQMKYITENGEIHYNPPHQFDKIILE